VAGLVGDPKETDEFTTNMVSLTLSHVKVEVDLTQPLPKIVEFERHNGEVVEVLVDYPWTPPTCSHCHELGHILKSCLQFTPPVNVQDDSHAKGKQSVHKTPAKKNGKQHIKVAKNGQNEIYVPVPKARTDASSSGPMDVEIPPSSALDPKPIDPPPSFTFSPSS